MRLYTYQSPEVVSQLWRDKVYRPSWDRSGWLTGDIGTYCTFEPAYRWLTEQYCLRRPAFAMETQPVWWYTNVEQARKELYVERGFCLFGAEVPDERVLLYDSDMWYAVLARSAYRIRAWENQDTPWEVVDRLDDVYRKPENAQATQDTWTNIFHLPRRDLHRLEVHAVTDCIHLKWVEDISRETSR